MEIISIIIASLSAAFSFITYVVTVRHEKRKATIEAFNSLQNEVLDKFVSVKNDNAKIIVENLSNEVYKNSYNDQRALIARLEHFAVGINDGARACNFVSGTVKSNFHKESPFRALYLHYITHGCNL
jgi:hypothetical protein